MCLFVLPLIRFVNGTSRGKEREGSLESFNEQPGLGTNRRYRQRDGEKVQRQRQIKTIERDRGREIEILEIRFHKNLFKTLNFRDKQSLSCLTNFRHVAIAFFKTFANIQKWQP